MLFAITYDKITIFTTGSKIFYKIK